MSTSKKLKSNKHTADQNRQAAFVEAYLVCWNATEAARRAGYKNPNKIGPRKLVEVGIQQAVATRIAELKASADEVLLRLASHSRGSMEYFLSPGGNIDLDRARDSGKLHLIKKFKLVTTTREDSETHTQEIELYDAQAATVQLAKILGQYIDRLSVTIKDDRPDSELVDELFRLANDLRARTGAGVDNGTPAAGADGGDKAKS